MLRLEETGKELNDFTEHGVFHSGMESSGFNITVEPDVCAQRKIFKDLFFINSTKNSQYFTAHV